MALFIFCFGECDLSLEHMAIGGSSVGDLSSLL